MNVAIITARGGSKRIPGKNIKPFAGRPILHYSIDAARASGVFDRIIVSTDCDEIANVATAGGAEVPFRRPAELSDDFTPTREVLLHAVDWLIEHDSRPDYICCLYPTAPFLEPQYIRQGFEVIQSTAAYAAASVTTFAFPIFRALKKNENGTLSLFWPEHEVTRSQDLPEAYHDAAQFYWLDAERFLQVRKVFSTETQPLVLPRYLVQDLDTLEDWETAERMFEARRTRLQAESLATSHTTTDTSEPSREDSIADHGQLAIHGGKPVRTRLFPGYRTIGDEEKSAVNRVLESNVLSRYLGCWHDDFYGGPEIRQLEQEWADYFGVKHAIAVNSNSSGLQCAVGAANIEPGDEVIVSPYSMCVSATAPLVFNAVPVFADIEPDYFCLDAESVERAVTPRTRALIVVDLFGLPYDVDAINAVARRHNLIVIEDCAQAPGAFYKDRPAGTLGDVGVYSLNYHKHIHCGEGGIVVTNDDRLAERIRLIANHAEAVVEAKGVSDLRNMLGFNFRMTELEAAIARCQLEKLERLVTLRQENCEHLAEKLAEIPAIEPPAIRPDCTHSWYVQPFKFHEEIAGIDRDAFIEAVRAELAPIEFREGEGVALSCGYTKPLYRLPIFRQKTAYGSQGCPFTKPWTDREVDYTQGTLPVVERLYEKELFLHELMRPPATRGDLDDVVRAFWKVWNRRGEIQPASRPASNKRPAA